MPDYYWDQTRAVPVDFLCSQWFLRPEWLQYMWVSFFFPNCRGCIWWQFICGAFSCVNIWFPSFLLPFLPFFLPSPLPSSLPTSQNHFHFELANVESGEDFYTSRTGKNVLSEASVPKEACRLKEDSMLKKNSMLRETKKRKEITTHIPQATNILNYTEINQNTESSQHSQRSLYTLKKSSIA